LSHIPLRRWEDWERSRLKKLRREEKRRQQLARNYPASGYYDAEGYLRAEQDPTQSQFFESGSSDTTSVVSSVEEDKWGAQIGGYNENNPAFPPPPATLLRPKAEILQNAHVVNMEELEAMLDQGFEPVQPQSYEPAVPAVPPLSRYQLSERPPNASSSRAARSPPGSGQQFDAFGPLSPNNRGTTAPRMRTLSPPPSSAQYAVPPPLMIAPYGVTTATDESKRHVRRRSNGGAGSEEDGGPLGPLGNAKNLPSSPRPRRI
jgi:chitin synthase